MVAVAAALVVAAAKIATVPAAVAFTAAAAAAAKHQQHQQHHQQQEAAAAVSSTAAANNSWPATPVVKLAMEHSMLRCTDVICRFSLLESAGTLMSNTLLPSVCNSSLPQTSVDYKNTTYNSPLSYTVTVAYVVSASRLARQLSPILLQLKVYEFIASRQIHLRS